MSFANPTPLKIGMTGNFGGIQYRVLGRVVMGVVEDGETYYWNEFNLETAAGESATLVFEESESGGQWRLFTLFEPQYPITAEDAASKRVGDPLNLDGTDVRVTLVEQSRVYSIEGQAPEGVEVGDVASYFNAEAGGTMDVVSWTGGEVECYHGITLPRGTVSAAFNIRLPDFSSLLPASDDGGDTSRATKVLICLVALLAAIGGYIFLRPHQRPPAVIKTSASPSPLIAGSPGRLRGTDYRIERHALVEIALVGRQFERHEYTLCNDNGDSALLVCGTRPGAKDWVLFTPLHPAEPLTPQQAGSVQLGQTVNVDGVVVQVGDLFQTTVRRVEGPGSNTGGEGDVLYGFAGSGPHAQLLARWNSSRIEFFQGVALAENDVATAFKPQQAPAR